MNRTPRIRLVFVVAIVLALIVAPLAGARSLENPQAAVLRAEGGWFGAALKWLEDLAGFRRPVPGHRDPSGAPATQKELTPMGGSCIDPMGNPKPNCA